jgi:hypothetical protein
MITYVVDGGHEYTIREFLRAWASDLQKHFRILPYQCLARQSDFPAGSYVFSDLERLNVYYRKFASEAADWLAHQRGTQVLNRPKRYLDRIDFLKEMAKSGRCDYRFLCGDQIHHFEKLRLPIFLRYAHEHQNLTGLLRSREDARTAIKKAWAQAPLLWRGKLMAVEFRDTSDGTGIFRKYSAMRVGESLIPRHVLFSTNWIVKKPDLIDADRVAEEEHFLDRFPERDQIMHLFKMAHVDYGRIDYAMINGCIVPWEINTNPMIVPSPDRIHEDRLPGQSRSADAIRNAFHDLILLEKRASATLPRAKRLTWGMRDIGYRALRAGRRLLQPLRKLAREWKPK